MGKPGRTWLVAAILASALAGGVLWWHAASGSGAPRGNIEQALKTDLADFDDQKLLDFVGRLRLDGSSQQQRVDLFNRLKARFDAMSLTMRLSMILSMRKLSQEQPKSTLMDNGRLLMMAYWNHEVSDYMKAPPEQRKKMLDARIDESLVYEDLQKLQDAAKGLFGGKSGPSDEELGQMRRNILDAAVDSMKNGTPEERSGGAQYFMDMRQRRQDRGLSVQF